MVSIVDKLGACLGRPVAENPQHPTQSSIAGDDRDRPYPPDRADAGVPLFFHMHYLGTMDYWDPTVTDGLARDREVILFNNAGVSSSSSEVPTTFEQMAADAIAFSRALGTMQRRN
jgi:pimeloyl-ACP methyl ester carboxylesterase